MLFEERNRTRQEPLGRGEDLYTFYDNCARDDYDELRTLLNGWLSAIPQEHRDELISRMQFGGTSAFGAALCEVVIATYLTGLNLKIVFHPDIPGSSKHPDFSVVDDVGNTSAFNVEPPLNVIPFR